MITNDSTTNDSSIMEELLENMGEIKIPKPGDLVEGTVIDIWKNKILVDLDGFTTGVISGQEAYDSSDTAKELQPGDTVLAYVLEDENEDGLMVLSLRKASQKKTWQKFIDAHESNETITVKANEANKGGLLLNIDGIKGFIPVSQLAPLHYPRVSGADTSQILARLQKLIGVPLLVKILNIDTEGGKLILSERAAESDQRKDALNKLEIGQKLKGKISGVVNFGIFVTFNGLEGLVHISEIAWGHVKDPHEYGKVGEEVEVLVIGKEKDKISLSMKRLVPDPWIEATKKYKVGSKITGKINRLTPFGAFVQLDDDINGLIHISEITNDEIKDPSEVIKVGDVIEAKIINIDPDEHRVGLSIKAINEKSDKKKETEKTKEVKKEEASKSEKEESEPSEQEDSEKSEKEEDKSEKSEDTEK